MSNLLGRFLLAFQRINYRIIIIESFELEGSLKGHLVQLPCRGCIQPDQSAQNPVQPDIDCLHGWVLHYSHHKKRLFLYPIVADNAKSWPEAVIEHLVEGRANTGAQVHAMLLSYKNRWSQNPPLSRPHFRFGNGSKGLLLEIPVYLRPSEGKRFFLLCFCVNGCCVCACSHLLQPRIVPLHYYCSTFRHVIPLQHYSMKYLNPQIVLSINSQSPSIWHR